MFFAKNNWPGFAAGYTWNNSLVILLAQNYKVNPCRAAFNVSQLASRTEESMASAPRGVAPLAIPPQPSFAFILHLMHHRAGSHALTPCQR